MDGSAFNGLGEALVGMFWIGAGAVICCIFLLIYVVWSWFSEPDWQREAISRGLAGYSQSTGEFAWIDQCAAKGVAK